MVARKPYRQKGTGRARQGSTRAPQFAGGGVVHGPQPRDYCQRTPKKMKAAALRGALSDRARHDRIHVIDLPRHGRRPSTKAAARHARRPDRAPQPARRARAAATRWPGRASATCDDVHVLVADQLNTYDVLCADDIVFTQAALDASRRRPREGCDQTADKGRRRREVTPDIHVARTPRHPDRAGRLGEVVRPARRGQVHLPRRPAREQDRDQDRRRAGLRRQGRLGPHAEPPGQDPPDPFRHRQAQGHQARDRHPQAKGSIDIFGAPAPELTKTARTAHHGYP